MNKKIKMVFLEDLQRKYGKDVTLLGKSQFEYPGTESPTGFGVQGAVTYLPIEDKLVSHLDGKTYKKISVAHVKKYGLKSVAEYKEKFELSKYTPLVSKGLSATLSINAEKSKANLIHRGLFPKRSNGGVKRSKARMEERNGKRACPAQMKFDLKTVEIIVGRNPSQADVEKFDRRLLKRLIYWYGDFNKAKIAMGYKVTPPNIVYEDVDVIARFREFVLTHKRLPRTSDFKDNLPSAATCRRHFGSMARTRQIARLNELLLEVKN